MYASAQQYPQYSQYPDKQPPGTYAYDVESGHEVGKPTVAVPAEGYSAFANKIVRQGFIRKVFGILAVQVAVTFGLTALFVFHSGVQRYVNGHGWTYGLAIALNIGCFIALVCCGDVRRRYPTNYVLLTLFTLSEAFMVATVSSYYEAKSVVLCIGMTFAITIALTLFAMQTKWDITMSGGILGAMLLALICFGFVQIFWRDPIVHSVYAALGAFIFCAYMVYDVQLIMGGRKFEISPDEYVFAALMLYLDIVNLFLFLLQLFGRDRN